LENFLSVEELSAPSLVKARLNEGAHFGQRGLVSCLLFFEEAEPFRDDLTRRCIAAGRDAGRDEIFKVQGDGHLQRS